MSERFRESALSALVTSKRFIVATCAAIAMVLGAMSGGASFFTPLTHHSGTQDNVGVVITPNNQASQPTSPDKDSTFTKQHAIEPQKLFTSTAATINNTASTKKSAVSNTAVTVPVANLFLSEIQLPLSIVGAAGSTSAGASAATGTSNSSGTASSTDTTPTTNGTAATTTDPTQTATTDPGTSTTTPPATNPVTPDSQNTNQQPPATNP